MGFNAGKGKVSLDKLSEPAREVSPPVLHNMANRTFVYAERARTPLQCQSRSAYHAGWRGLSGLKLCDDYTLAERVKSANIVACRAVLMRLRCFENRISATDAELGCKRIVSHGNDPLHRHLSNHS